MSEDQTAKTLDDVFGERRVAPLSRLQRFTAAHMDRCWRSIPHVFHQDEADVTTLEASRASLPAPRPSMLALVAEQLTNLLQRQPKFNAEFDVDGSALVLRQKVNLGFAIDTPNGLVVGVVRDCAARSARGIADAVGDMAQRARGRGLGVEDMEGGTFTISSLGAKGGTGFTPIINGPQVAILGLSRLIERPVKAADGTLEWRTFLPLSLSYDHRVINGAEASEFMAALRIGLSSVDLAAVPEREGV